MEIANLQAEEFDSMTRRPARDNVKTTTDLF